MMGLVVLGMVKLGNPKAWQWVRNLDRTPAPPEPSAPPAPKLDLELEMRLRDMALQWAVPTTPFANPAALDCAFLAILQLEHVPLPPAPRPSDRPARKSLPAEAATVQGAAQRERFLEAPPEERYNPLFQFERRDEDARRHLIGLAKAQTDAQIAADGRTNFRYSALVQRPEEYVGEVLTIEGDLLWAVVFEVKNPGPHLPDFVYLGHIQAGSRDRNYWVFFLDLPPGMPPEKEWPHLYLRGVKFSGYFHKIVKVEPAPQEKDPTVRYLPVLIGKSITLPPPEATTDWKSIVLTLAAVLGAAVLLAAIGLWFYYRSERRYLAKMAQLRSRTDQPFLDDNIPAEPKNPFSQP